jgi:hypothetical protein
MLVVWLRVLFLQKVYDLQLRGFDLGVSLFMNYLVEYAHSLKCEFIYSQLFRAIMHCFIKRQTER